MIRKQHLINTMELLGKERSRLSNQIHNLKVWVDTMMHDQSTESFGVQCSDSDVFTIMRVRNNDGSYGWKTHFNEKPNIEVTFHQTNNFDHLTAEIIQNVATFFQTNPNYDISYQEKFSEECSSNECDTELKTTKREYYSQSIPLDLECIDREFSMAFKKNTLSEGSVIGLLVVDHHDQAYTGNFYKVINSMKDFLFQLIMNPLY